MASNTIGSITEFNSRERENSGIFRVRTTFLRGKWHQRRQASPSFPYCDW